MAQAFDAMQVETLAGGHEFTDGQTGRQLGVGQFLGLGMDGQGRLLVSVRELDRVFLRDPNGKLRVCAGTGVWAYPQGQRLTFGGDGGPARDAYLYGPAGVAGGNQGEVYVSDAKNFRIRRIGPDGTIQTVVGTGQSGVLPLQDFPAGGLSGLSVPLCSRCEMTVDGRGHLWFSDPKAQRVYDLDPATGLVRVALCRAWNQVGDPRALAVAGEHLFVADGFTARVLVLDLRTGEVACWLGRPRGPLALNFRNLAGLAYDGGHYLYLSDERLNQVFRCDLRDRSVARFAGTGEARLSGDGGPALEARFHWPRSLAVGADGTVYVADTMNFRVRAIGADGRVQTVVGRDLGDGGPAAEACLLWPQGVAVDADGCVYVSDSEHCRVRRIDPSSGLIETVAGGGTLEPRLPRRWEGDPRQVYIGYPLGLALDGEGHLYIADEKGPCVWELDLTRKNIRCFARDQRMRGPIDVAVGGEGQLHIADREGHVVWLADRQGRLSVFAGMLRQRGFSGDGGAAASGRLSGPRAVACGPGGEVYVSDQGNLRVREIRDGRIGTWAGTGGKGHPQEGQDARYSPLSFLTTLKVDEAGRVIACYGPWACCIDAVSHKAHWLLTDPSTRPSARIQFAYLAAGRGELLVADQKYHAVHRIRTG
jgi:sugar lactone lactonase YvrE